MSFNIWVGGEPGGQPLEQTVRVIRESNADIVGMQEVRGQAKDRKRPDNGAKIAEMLGWHYFNQGSSTSILSRWPIKSKTPNKWGARIAVSESIDLFVFNVHFPASPYQPYQLLGIPYGNAPFIKTEDEAIDWAKKSRGKQVASLLDELTPVAKAGKAVVVTGDFNEPSHQDWTDRAALAGRCPIRVAYPSTKSLTDLGLSDSFRTVHVDEVTNPGWTWTPTTKPSDPKDKHDRIDFVFAGGANVKVLDSKVVGESKENAQVVVTPWPSDHRAVITTLSIE
ncbi:MAG: endonuclease/exonuclease/phosphatase family protein [Planctomycetales bacterium]|nr:endonuclease/exonuclease/phosphatase family protein [Planctomycetales bacterium]